MQEKVLRSIKGIQLPAAIFLETFWIGDLVCIIAENTIQRLLSRRFQGQPTNNKNVSLAYRRCDPSFPGYHIYSFQFRR
jgi:hypothetical protein